MPRGLAAASRFCYLGLLMSDAPAFVIRFAEASLARAGGLAGALREVLLDAAPGVQADVLRTDPQSMDLGSALRVGVPADAAAPVSQRLSDYLARERPGLVVIERAGRVVYRGDGADATLIARALASRAGQGW